MATQTVVKVVKDGVKTTISVPNNVPSSGKQHYEMVLAHEKADSSKQ